MSGISNFTIEKIINEDDDHLKANFVGVFPFNHIFRFVSFSGLVNEKNAPFPFMIMNTDRAGKQGTHWWSFLEISSKNQIFLFDSYGFIELKEFIIDNDRKIIDKFFHGLSKMSKKDSAINLTYVEFVPPAYEKINRFRLATTAQEFFHTLNEFSKTHRLKKVDADMVDDCLQQLDTDTCGIFQFYFHTNVFLPSYKSKIMNSKKLTIKTITTLLNELFVLDKPENERRVENFEQQLDIKRE